MHGAKSVSIVSSSFTSIFQQCVFLNGRAPTRAMSSMSSWGCIEALTGHVQHVVAKLILGIQSWRFTKPQGLIGGYNPLTRPALSIFWGAILRFASIYVCDSQKFANKPHVPPHMWVYFWVLSLAGMIQSWLLYVASRRCAQLRNRQRAKTVGSLQRTTLYNI